MCFSGICPYEKWSGECGKKPSQVCPMAFETEEEFEYAKQAALDDEDVEYNIDDYNDYLNGQERG